MRSVCILLAVCLFLAGCGSKSAPKEHATTEQSEESAGGDAAARAPERTDAEAPAESGKAAEGFSVTDVRELSEGMYSATLNGVLVFADLEIRDAGGAKKLYFPKSASRGGRAFDIVKFEDVSIPRAIKEAILSRKTTKLEKPVSIPITAVKVKKHESGALRAFIDVTFGDVFTVYGMKVMDGKNGLWVAWPAVKEGSEWRDMVFPITKEFREEISVKVIGEYEKAE